jgi:hypothetical protein
MLEELQIGDRLRLRKAHPCGGYEWEVVRLGADIGLVCQTCGHKVFISRRDLEKRVRGKVKQETGNQETGNGKKESGNG